MTTVVLDKDKTRTAPFFITGDCYICAKGNGTVRFLREMNGKFEVITDSFGEALTFTGDGIIFNSSITCNARLRHVVEAVTTSHIHVTVEKEKA